MNTKSLTLLPRNGLSQVKEFYDQKYLKGKFKRHRYLDYLFVRSLASKFKIRRSAWILDVWCGTGWYTYLLSRLSIKVVGVDLSRTAILRARQTWKMSNAHWIVCDAFNLPLKKQFDVIFCSGLSLFNVSDLRTCAPFAEKLLGHLKSGGLFIYVESSNLSGVYTTVANHSLQQVYDFFSGLRSLSDVKVYAVNVQFFLIFGSKAFNSLVSRLTSLLLKIHRRSCRIICISKKM